MKEITEKVLDVAIKEVEKPENSRKTSKKMSREEWLKATEGKELPKIAKGFRDAVLNPAGIADWDAVNK